jgi:hypothetical protein
MPMGIARGIPPAFWIALIYACPSWQTGESDALVDAVLVRPINGYGVDCMWFSEIKEKNLIKNQK